MNRNKLSLLHESNYYQQFWKNGHPIPSIFNPQVQIVHERRKMNDGNLQNQK